MTSEVHEKNALGSVGEALGIVGKCWGNGFGHILEKSRLKGLKISDLAKAIGVSRSSLCHYLKGRIDKCGRNQARKIEKFLIENLIEKRKKREVLKELKKKAFLIHNGEIILHYEISGNKKKWYNAIKSIEGNEI